MELSSGNSWVSTKIQSSGSEEDLQVLMDQRKRKRMQSNRESAKRSRMRKQKHLDDLMAQVNELRKENSEILSSISITTQRFLNVESENSILRARMVELSHRLQSLNDILNYINTTAGVYESDHTYLFPDNFINIPFLNQPIMASADIFQCNLYFLHKLIRLSLCMSATIMGSACCVAAKDQTLPNKNGNENLHRNVTCSPSWSFQWDSQGRVAGEIENPSYHMSHGVRRNAGMELKELSSHERANLSDGGITLENPVTPNSQKSPVHEASIANLMIPSSDMSNTSNCSTVVNNPSESPEIAESSLPNLPFSIPSVLSTPGDPLPIHKYHHLPNSVPSRWAHCSPGHPLLRQISDSWILGLKSQDNSISEGRPSFVLSSCSNDMAAGSQGGSSDGWSMRTFSELVASSQRERWSFDIEYFGSGHGKISGSSSRFSYSPSMDLQSCGACSKHVSERCALSNQKFIASNDLSVVAVLVCGHVYHAECLETMTAEADKYDPVCPVCTINGEKQESKLSRKGVCREAEMKAKNHKISKNRVVDSYVEGGFDVFDDRQKELESGNGGRENFEKMEASCSSRSRSSSGIGIGKPFLKRHFSLGSKKGFWSRYPKA
ncbi:uncharacterized protein G2W53_011966 [Senna tora]|uniref:Uncharacterized protein n=1 Tax=Senna tora TaxID=362788 RepID=A0A834TW33_9FABA|nr:uncharacterized protein G2W53_011966 [Senna tora]